MRNTYAPALVLVAVLVPIPVFATVISVVFYVILGQQFGLVAWLNWVALLFGLGVTLIAWLIGAIFCRRLATARYSNKLSYDAILQELRRLEMNFDTIEVNDPEEASELEEVIESAATVQAVKVAGTDEVAVTAHAVGVVSATEANGAVEPTPTSHDTGALQRAYAALYGDNEDERIENCLQVNGMQWIRSTGYIDIWNRLHAADQEMTVLLPKETLEIDADYDLLRLDGSTIPNSQHWMDIINTAKATLERVDKQKRARKALDDHTQQAAKEQQLLGQAMLDLIKATVSSPELPLNEEDIPKSFGPALFSILKSAFLDPPPEVHQTEEQARADLRQARIAINTYVTNRWAGLIASRNRLIETSFFASIFIYLLFVVAMLANAPASALVTGLVFYFVGAVAGLFPRLAPKMTRSNQPSKAPNPPPKANNTAKAAGKPAKAASQSNGAKANGNGKSTAQKGSARPNASSSDDSPPSDDYGLTMARVLITPVFSGLAALIGVGLATLLSITLVTLTPAQSSTSPSVATPTAVVATVTPTAAVSSATAPTSRTVPNYPSLDQVYSLTTNVQGVIFAVIFGFLPSLVINALQKEASLMMGQLKSTDPGEDGGG